MASNSNDTHKVPGISAIRRIIYGIAGGIAASIAISLLPIGLIYLLVALKTPPPPVIILALLGLIVIFGFVLGGYISRRIAGQELLKGWIGAICALVFMVILSLLPGRGWVWTPEQGWRPTEFEPSGIIIRDYTIWLRLITVLFIAYLGRIGDQWAARRLYSRTADKNN